MLAQPLCIYRTTSSHQVSCVASQSSRSHSHHGSSRCHSFGSEINKQNDNNMTRVALIFMLITFKPLIAFSSPEIDRWMTDAYAYFNGVGVERDENRAVYLWQKASEAGDSNAKRNLLNYYSTQRDAYSAIPLAEELADEGDPIAQVMLFHIREEVGNLGLQNEEARVLSWLQSATEAGQAGARRALLLTYLNANQISEAQDYFFSLARSRPDLKEVRETARTLKLSSNDVEVYWEGVREIELLAEQGDQTSMAILMGLFYPYLKEEFLQVHPNLSFLPAHPDPSRFKKWLTLLADQRNAAGLEILGMAHLYDWEGFERSLLLARESFLEAEKNGSDKGYYDFAPLWYQMINSLLNQEVDCKATLQQAKSFPISANAWAGMTCEGLTDERRIELFFMSGKSGSAYMAMLAAAGYVDKRQAVLARESLGYVDRERCLSRLSVAENEFLPYLCDYDSDLLGEIKSELRDLEKSQQAAVDRRPTSGRFAESRSPPAKIKKKSKAGDIAKNLTNGFLSFLGVIVESALVGAAQGLSDAATVYAVSEITGQDPSDVYSRMREEKPDPVFKAGQYKSTDCACTCVNGTYQPLCSSYAAVKPICVHRVCPPVIYTPTPIDTTRVPPVGTRSCRQEQVFNYALRKYEWKTVCR